MNRSKRLVLLLIAGLLLCVSSWAEQRQFTILYTNDTHDFLLPFSYPDPINPKIQYASMPMIKNIGGIARRATLARQIKNEVMGNALFVDAGDIMEGQALGVIYKGAADFEAMSAAGYDAMVLGNHDFQCSLEQFYRNVWTPRFDILCANLLDLKTHKMILPPYRILDVNGLKVGLVGVTAVMAKDCEAAKGNMDLLDPYETAGRFVPIVRRKADLVVVLSHLGNGEDGKLAREVPGIDIIVGAHSHTRLPEPQVINGVIILQDYEKGGELGRLDLKLDNESGSYKIVGQSNKLIPVTRDIPEDKATAKVVSKYYDPIAREYGRTIGKATATFYDDRAHESTALNLVCDAIREKAKTPISFYGYGGIRADLLAGPIKAWDVATVLPFKNKIVILDMPGSKLKWIIDDLTYKPGVSGMTYHTVSKKLVEAKLPDGTPIEDNVIYQVATIDWLQGLYFEDIPFREINATSYSAVVDYIKAHKTVSPVTDGRKKIE